MGKTKWTDEQRHCCFVVLLLCCFVVMLFVHFVHFGECCKIPYGPVRFRCVFTRETRHQSSWSLLPQPVKRNDRTPNGSPVNVLIPLCWQVSAWHSRWFFQSGLASPNNMGSGRRWAHILNTWPYSSVDRSWKQSIAPYILLRTSALLMGWPH